jgi:UDP-N-acetylmuramyl pentapeptide phosphotransferase/UDP-N-acetylglucosamine-1-phosphate transferase
MAVVLMVAALVSPAPALWAVVGALLGFMPWNWSPARVFMGDVGSTYLGALLAGVTLQQATPAQALGLLLVAFPLLGDACLCVLRRLAAGQRVFQAHRLHLYQRLHQAGWSHSRVAVLYIGATAAGGVALLIGGLAALLPLLAGQLLLAARLERGVAVPFSTAVELSERSNTMRKTD